MSGLVSVAFHANVATTLLHFKGIHQGIVLVLGSKVSMEHVTSSELIGRNIQTFDCLSGLDFKVSK